MDHPLSNSVASVARIMANGSDIPVPNAAALIEEIAPFREQYAALSIACFSYNDLDGLLEVRDSEIRGEGDVE